MQMGLRPGIVTTRAPSATAGLGYTMGYAGRTAALLAVVTIYVKAAHDTIT